MLHGLDLYTYRSRRSWPGESPAVALAAARNNAGNELPPAHPADVAMHRMQTRPWPYDARNTWRLAYSVARIDQRSRHGND
jgi:hypothetical protein